MYVVLYAYTVLKYLVFWILQILPCNISAEHILNPWKGCLCLVRHTHVHTLAPGREWVTRQEVSKAVGKKKKEADLAVKEASIISISNIILATLSLHHNPLRYHSTVWNC